MTQRYLIEIADGPSPYYNFAYFDTGEYLAAFLFDRFKLDVWATAEYYGDDDPYRIIEVRVPKEQRDAFLYCIDQLPSLMAYMGNKDYDAYCQEFLMKAGRHFAAKGSRGITPLQ